MDLIGVFESSDQNVVGHQGINTGDTQLFTFTENGDGITGLTRMYRYFIIRIADAVGGGLISIYDIRLLN